MISIQRIYRGRFGPCLADPNVALLVLLAPTFEEQKAENLCSAGDRQVEQLRDLLIKQHGPK